MSNKTFSSESHFDIWSATRTLIKLQRQTPPIQPVSKDQPIPIPLSLAQKRLWSLAQMESNGYVYNSLAAYRLIGLLNVAVLEQSLAEIIRRHSILRTTLPIVDGQPIQLISSDIAFTLNIVDLHQLPLEQREVKIQQLITEEAQKTFALTQEPGFRVQLLRLSQEEHILLLIIHHIIFDGWSFQVLLRELTTLYEAFSNGHPSPLKELPIQYADFAVWQRECLQQEVNELQLNYWKHQLNGNVEALQLPTEQKHSLGYNYHGSSQYFKLSQDLSKAINILSQQEGVTLFVTLLAAYKTLLYQYTRQEYIILCSPVAGRNRPEIKELIGYFNNILPMRTNLGGNPTFRELLHRVQQIALGAYQYQDLPFQKLTELPNLVRTPLSRGAFILQNFQSQPLELLGVNVTIFPIHTETSNFDLSLTIYEEGSNLTGLLRYKTDLFEPVTILQMIENFQILLEKIIAYPDVHLESLPSFTKIEPHQKFNQTSKEIFIAPRDELELKLTKIWEQVLGIAPIGIRDNFFNLGGHSLLAVHLLAEIEKQLAINLPLATLFQIRTIEGQANLIRQKGWSIYSQLLVLIKQGSSFKAPLFCMHAVGPSILNYQNLTPYLDLEQPVYGLQAQGLNGKQAPLTRIEDMASQYIEEIQTVQPEGPYYLLGHSFGGLVAFEMAQQLHAQGQKIALLALLDTINPKIYKITPPLYHQLFIHGLNLSNLKSKEKLIYILERIQWNLERIYKKIANKFNFWLKYQDSVQFPEKYQLIEEADRVASKNYIPQIYPASITLFRSIVRPTKIFYDPELGWRDLVAGEIEIHEVPGNHLTMILEPYVQVLGGKLRAKIEALLQKG